MKNNILIAYHRLRMNWYRTNANSIAMRGGLNHIARLQMDPEYRSSYYKYNESKKRLVELGALPEKPYR